MTVIELEKKLRYDSRGFALSELLQSDFEPLRGPCSELLDTYILEGDSDPDYASALIRLCKKVIPFSFDEFTAFDFFGEPRLDVNSILGALVDLKLGGEDFWRRIAANVPEEMKTLVFSGLWNVNQEAALEFLKELPNTQSAGDNLYIILSFKNAAPDELKSYIEGCQEEIQSAIRDFINEKS